MARGTTNGDSSGGGRALQRQDRECAAHPAYEMDHSERFSAGSTETRTFLYTRPAQVCARIPSGKPGKMYYIVTSNCLLLLLCTSSVHPPGPLRSVVRICKAGLLHSSGRM